MLLRFLGPTQRTCDGWTRRDLLHAGGLAALNVCLPQLLSQAHAAPAATGFGRAKACVVIYHFGGPSHIDLWDLKPNAPAEFRGEFRPIATNVPRAAHQQIGHPSLRACVMLFRCGTSGVPPLPRIT